MKRTHHPTLKLRIPTVQVEYEIYYHDRHCGGVTIISRPSIMRDEVPTQATGLFRTATSAKSTMAMHTSARKQGTTRDTRPSTAPPLRQTWAISVSLPTASRMANSLILNTAPAHVDGEQCVEHGSDGTECNSMHGSYHRLGDARRCANHSLESLDVAKMGAR